jgi:NADH pyrophosphatase NudC (nudix superfamily)
VTNERTNTRKCTACGAVGGHVDGCRLQNCPVCNDPEYPRHDPATWAKYHAPTDSDRSREHGKL